MWFSMRSQREELFIQEVVLFLLTPPDFLNCVIYRLDKGNVIFKSGLERKPQHFVDPRLDLLHGQFFGEFIYLYELDGAHATQITHIIRADDHAARMKLFTNFYILELVICRAAKYFEVDAPASELADDVIVKIAKEWKALVFTNDRQLKKRLRDISVPVIYVRQKSRLEIDGMI